MSTNAERRNLEPMEELKKAVEFLHKKHLELEVEVKENTKLTKQTCDTLKNLSRDTAELVSIVNGAKIIKTGAGLIRNWVTFWTPIIAFVALASAIWHNNWHAIVDYFKGN